MKETLKILSKLEEELQKDGFKKQHRINEKSFSRNRVLTFVTTTLILLNKVSKSLGVELSKFLQRFNKPIVSKQAFSKARYKLKASAFTQLNRVLVSQFYSMDDYQLYQDKYILLCSDGTDFHLPWTDEMVEEFSLMDNGLSDQPKCLAKCIKIWDVLNGLTIETELCNYEAAEINMFAQTWSKVEVYFPPNLNQ